MQCPQLQHETRDASLNVHAGEMFRVEVRWSGRRLAVSYNGESLFEWLPRGQQSDITLATFDVTGDFDVQFLGFLPKGELCILDNIEKSLNIHTRVAHVWWSWKNFC